MKTINIFRNDWPIFLLVVPMILFYFYGLSNDIKPFCLTNGTNFKNYTLITYQFCSVSALHLVINTVALSTIISSFTEEKTWIKILVIIGFITAGIGSGFISMYFNLPGTITAGASGSIYAGFSFIRFFDLYDCYMYDREKFKNELVIWILFWGFNVYINYVGIIYAAFNINIINHIIGLIIGSMYGIIYIFYKLIKQTT
jgi:membrane associated rhomboid family serine protease